MKVYRGTFALNNANEQSIAITSDRDFVLHISVSNHAPRQVPFGITTPPASFRTIASGSSTEDGIAYLIARDEARFLCTIGGAAGETFVLASDNVPGAIDVSITLVTSAKAVVNMTGQP